MRKTSITAIATCVLLAIGFAARAGAPVIEGDAAKAEPIVTSQCAGCHGQDGNSPVPNFPKLAGQPAEYLLREMSDYKTGKRKSEIMLPFIANLSDEDMANLAVYFAGQKISPGTVNKPELLKWGKELYFGGNTRTGLPSCDGCHFEDGAGSGRFPRLAGQHVEYTLEQLRQYTAGERSNGVKIMRVVAKRMSEQEAQALAEFVASLP